MATALCEKHKLRFDPETQTGCVLCRREAGQVSPSAGAPPPTPVEAGAERPLPAIAPVRAAPAPAVAPPAAAAPEPTEIARPLAIAALIWLVSAVVLYGIHARLAANFLYGETGANEASLGVLDDDAEAVRPGAGTAVGQTEAVLDEIAKLNQDGDAGADGGEPTEGEDATAEDDGGVEAP